MERIKTAENANNEIKQKCYRTLWSVFGVRFKVTKEEEKKKKCGTETQQTALGFIWVLCNPTQCLPTNQFISLKDGRIIDLQMKQVADVPRTILHRIEANQ